MRWVDKTQYKPNETGEIEKNKSREVLCQHVCFKEPFFLILSGFLSTSLSLSPNNMTIILADVFCPIHIKYHITKPHGFYKNAPLYQ